MLEKNRIFIKIILIIMLIFVLITNIYEVNASSGDSIISEMEGDISKFKAAAEGTSIDTTKVTEKFVGLGQVLTMIGAGIMVAVTTYMGIKYLTEGPEAQAKLKTQLFGLIVSGLVIFGAYFIWQLVIKVVSTF